MTLMPSWLFKKQNSLTWVLSVAFLTIPDMSPGEPHHHAHDHDQQIQHDSHVHGQAELLIVLEGSLLSMEFRSPAMNVVGFEHRANTDEQRAAAKDAQAHLRDGQSLFDFGRAHCELSEHKLSFGGLLEEHHGHGHEQDEATKHSDIVAEYVFECSRPDSLTTLSTRIPKLFSGIEELEAQWIVNGRQGAVTLDNRQHTLVFR